MSATMVNWISFILVLGKCVWQCLAQDGGFCPPTSSGGLGGTLRVYNSTLFPASSFRNETDRNSYQVWPEDISNPRFRFPCQGAASNRSLTNFTVSCDQRSGRLDPRPYFDIGTANHLQPYYKHWTYSETIPTPEIQIWCERNDMRRLYSQRIWTKALRPAVLTTIVLVIIVEVTVVALLCASAWRRVQLKNHLATLPRRRWAHEFLGKYLGGHDTIADGLQLLLLVMAGFCMIEAVSHSSSTSWRSICMLDAAVLYTYLTLFAVLSSFARQLATAHRETARDRQLQAEAKRNDMEMQQSSHHSAASGRVSDDDNDENPPTQALSRSLTTASQPEKVQHGGGDAGELEDYGKEGNDWRWQRVFNQFAVVILMTAFLSYNENFAGNALESLVSVIWSVIMVAAVWSIGVSIVIGARSVLSLATFLPRSGRKGHPPRLQKPNTAP